MKTGITNASASAEWCGMLILHGHQFFPSQILHKITVSVRFLHLFFRYKRDTKCRNQMLVIHRDVIKPFYHKMKLFLSLIKPSYS